MPTFLTMAEIRSGHARPLARNALLNLGGYLAPLVAAAIALPVLTRALSAERLGIITLAWVVLASSGLIDLGLGRALTHALAARLAINARETLPSFVLTSCTVLVAVGGAAGLLLAASASWLTVGVFEVSSALREEMRLSLYLLAVALPFMTAGSAIRGVLEALQRFDLVNLVRTPLGILTYIGPVLVLPISGSAAAAVAVLTAARVAAVVAYIGVLLRAMPFIARDGRLESHILPELVTTGGWITVANLAGALMAYLDRFVLSSTLSMAALAYYAAPQELVMKLTIVPVALGAVMFPVFSSTFASKGPAVVAPLGKLALYILLLLFPITLGGAAFAPEFVGLWLGVAFAENSSGLMQLFCLGLLANGFAVAPVLFLQGIGRADLTAKIQLLELPLYFGGLWWAAGAFGARGVALVWVLRLLADAVIMLSASYRSLNVPPSGRLATVGTLMVISFALVVSAGSLTTRASLYLVAMLGFAAALPFLIGSRDRSLVASVWRRLREAAR